MAKLPCDPIGTTPMLQNCNNRKSVWSAILNVRWLARCIYIALPITFKVYETWSLNVEIIGKYTCEREKIRTHPNGSTKLQRNTPAPRLISVKRQSGPAVLGKVACLRGGGTANTSYLQLLHCSVGSLCESAIFKCTPGRPCSVSRANMLALTSLRRVTLMATFQYFVGSRVYPCS